MKRIHFNFPACGAAFLSAGAALLQFGTDKKLWWVANAMLIIGPIFMAIKRK